MRGVAAFVIAAAVIAATATSANAAPLTPSTATVALHDVERESLISGSYGRGTCRVPSMAVAELGVKTDRKCRSRSSAP